MPIKTNNPRYGNIFASVDNFDELRSINANDISDGTSAIVNGAVVRGDGRGGLFVWISTATDDDDDDKVLAPGDGGTGRWKLIRN